MFSEAFTKLEIEEVAEIIDHVNAQAEGSLFDPLETTVLSVSVPFYPGYRFLDIADHASHPPLQRYALNKGKDFVLLNWSYKPIYDLNEQAPIKLDERNVLDYVRFFFSHVKGRHGRFKVIEGMDGIEWKDDLNIETRKSYGQMIAPMKIEEKTKEGIFKIKAMMMLKETLFKVDVYVEPNGRVTLSEHEVLVEEMPVLDEIFTQ
jgi:hypothetical protein